MELKFNILPNEQSIFFIDQTMENYTGLYAIPDAREICFVTHELVINAVEAMEKSRRMETIEVYIKYENKQIQITVTDYADGIPEEQWTVVTDRNVTDLSCSERGRGFLFIQHMVDQLWFENLPESRFLVGVKKNLNKAEEM